MLTKSPTLYLLAVLCALLVNPAQAAVQRAYVASYGLDANAATDCQVLNPCRWFFTAVTVVNPDGEVVALDSASYGPVTLTQSISLTAAPGVYAGISVFPAAIAGVSIGTPGINVVLRGLTINGQGGAVGVLMTAGNKLSIENCVISNFFVNNSDRQYGVFVESAATVRMVDTLVRDNDIGIQLQAGATADISGSTFLGNSGVGIVMLNSTAGTTTAAAVSNTVVAGSGIGIYALADTNTAVAKIEMNRTIVSNSAIGVTVESAVGAASVSMRKSMVTGSSIHGLANLFSNGTLTSYGNNTLSNNSNNVAGTLTTAAPL